VRDVTVQIAKDEKLTRLDQTIAQSLSCCRVRELLYGLLIFEEMASILEIVQPV